MRKYLWPFALFIGVSLVARPIAAIAFPQFSLLTGYVTGATVSFLLYIGLSAGISAVLLAVLYLPMRSAGRDTLRLIWGYSIAARCITALVTIGAASTGFGNSPYEPVMPLMLSGLISLAPLLWFARAASRLSLTHAFFLAFIAGGLSLPPGLDDLLPSYGAWFLQLAANIVAVWLLANFDERGARFRKSAAIAIIGWHGLAALMALIGELLLALFALPLSALLSAALLVWSLFGAAMFLLQLLLVYLVRVRGASPPPDPA